MGERQVPSYLLIPWEGREGVKPLIPSPCPSPSRVDANARKKHLILKSCQGADLIEVLYYHACDSGLPPKSEYVKCLLNLQAQHISARFAVYLTGKDRLWALPLIPVSTVLNWPGRQQRRDKKHPIFLLFLLESFI